jgi:electron transport protein HydN
MSVQQSSFVLADPGKCSGCRACEVACFAGHRPQQGKTIGTVTSPVTPRLFVSRNFDDKGIGKCMPIQCHHCEDAPCLKACVAGAIERKDGVVFINERKCIGCRNCALACPFGAVQVFSREELSVQKTAKVASLVFKCDLCRESDSPACVKTCPNEALQIVKPDDAIRDKRIAAISAFDAFHTADTLPGAKKCTCDDKKEEK